MEILTIGKVACALGVTKERLYYLENRGIISKSRRTSDGRRFYLPRDVQRLRKELLNRIPSSGNQRA